MNRPRTLVDRLGLALAPLAAGGLALGFQRLLQGESVREGAFRLALATLGVSLLETARLALGLEAGPSTWLALAATVALWAASLAHAPEAALATGAFCVLGARFALLAVQGLRGPGSEARRPPPGPAGLTLAAALVVAALAPVPLARAGALALALLALGQLRARATLPARAAACLALLVLVLAQVAPVAVRDEAVPGTVARLALLVGLGLVWSRAVARDLEVRLEPSLLAPLVLAVGATFVLDALPLEAPYAWRGDENFHMFRVDRFLADVDLPGLGSLVLGALALALAAPLARRFAPGRAGLVPAAVGLAALALAVVLESRRISRGIVERYPIVEVWPQELLAFAPTSLLESAWRHDPGWYRLLPIVATLGAAYAIARGAPHPSPWARALAGLAFATLPTVRYYASLLYLEMPIVLGMLLVLADVARERPRRGLPESPLALAALAVVPFLKETAVPFALLLAAYSLGCAFLGTPAGPERRRALARTAAFFLVPLLYGTVLRRETRPYAPTAALLLDPRAWRILGHALAQQFGPLALLAPVGFVSAWRRGRPDLALLLGGLVGGYLLALGLDGFGFLCLFHARFMLVIVAPVAVLAAEVLRARLLERRAAWLALLGSLVVANLALSPVSVGGERVAFWGTYTMPGQDFVYPWDQAFARIARAPRHRVVEVLGAEKDTPAWRYVELLGLACEVRHRLVPEPIADGGWGDRVSGDGLAPPAPLVARIRADLEEAARGDADVLLVLLPLGDAVTEWPQNVGPFRGEALVSGTCRLLVYRRG